MIILAVICVLLVRFSSAADDLSRGESVYKGSCIACHGSDGAGSFPGVPNLADKAGPLSRDDDVLLNRMINGFQSPGSPMGMPSRGGDPTLTDADLKAALKYMRNKFQQPQ
ncbi:c-type cytochrome [Crenobacter sp. SG2305]|uniref:c-type cytochrome n=1 Tax=Crenobacter oryzisoli TaxID=3056844 RepID=UPI0025AAF464|nr:c-type cytochrome [Crenobacter sp. SG2305]MDN0084948.1 c-type cytochrome [Crenobacter sp. SG2305]